MQLANKSMKALGKELADTARQHRILSENLNLPHFGEKYESIGNGPLSATGITVFQINVGKRCNMVCQHCHVDAGPDRREVMTKETMTQCLDALGKTEIPTVDITGGAPEMNPNFKWFIRELRKLNRHVMVRSNLTILVTNGFTDYADFMEEHGIELISSLPCYTAPNTDAQRGEGTFEASIAAIHKLNALGYGKENTDLKLNLVHNSIGASLPKNQCCLEKEYKEKLLKEFGIVFNSLYTITNMPINRFLDYLIISGNYGSYMETLVSHFNPLAAQSVMCKNTISIGWDGTLYDCDFNQMLDLPVNNGVPNHVKAFDADLLNRRKIVTGQHCYGCTAGAGSSCGGATT
ncbi:MAG: radical SAM/Cys-rich domain protein [Chlorobiales bacterium]|nr:radical SAM/Cys-rich domain protein [Chlorobiales bacterium]